MDWAFSPLDLPVRKPRATPRLVPAEPLVLQPLRQSLSELTCQRSLMIRFMFLGRVCLKAGLSQFPKASFSKKNSLQKTLRIQSSGNEAVGATKLLEELRSDWKQHYFVCHPLSSLTPAPEASLIGRPNTASAASSQIIQNLRVVCDRLRFIVVLAAVMHRVTADCV